MVELSSVAVGAGHDSAADRACYASWRSLVSAARFMILAGVLASAAMFVTPPTALAREVVATEAQRGRTVRLRSGDRLRVTLPSNGTTGFAWTVAGMPEHLRQVTDLVEAAAVPPGLVGAEGRQILIFEAKGPGTGVLRLRYRQPWKGGMTGDRLSLRVETSR